MKSNVRELVEQGSKEIPFANLDLEFYKCCFALTESICEGRITYGIRAEDLSKYGEIINVNEILDVFYDESLVLQIIQELNKNKVSFIHFRDIVEDLLVDSIYT